MKYCEVIEISSEEAVKALKADKRTKIHCFLGFIGADWSKKSIIALAKKSKRLAWADNMFRHNLAIIADNKLYNFDLVFPLTKSK